MVDVITPTATIFENGRRKWIEVHYDGFNAATEYGIYDVLGAQIDFVPNHATAICIRTSGAENTIDIDIEVSWDGTTYIKTDLDNFTAFNSYKHHPAAGAADDKSRLRPRYWKAYVVDEGTNNVDQVKLWLYEG